MPAALRLVSDNTATQNCRAQLIEDAVRAAAHAEFPFGVQNMGIAQVLQKVIWAPHSAEQFASDVLVAWRVQNDPNEAASTPRGLA